MIITFPAGTGNFIIVAIVSVIFGSFGWILGFVFWMEWTDHSASLTDPAPLLCWGLVSALTWLLITNRIKLREAAA